MSYKDFIEKFVDSSSLSEKDSKLLALEMESDFYAKEKDLILNNEKDTMKKIEDDFGDKDKLAEQMFLAHHKYLNIPILGPLFYFKAIRWVMIILILYPLNVMSANWFHGLFPNLTITYAADNSPFNLSTFIYIIGYLLPFILVIFLFIRFKTSTKDIIFSSLASLFIVYLIISLFFMTYNRSFTNPTSADFIIFGIMASPYILLILITLAFKRILKK